MSISSIGSSYSAYTYQWQGQQLQGASANSNSSASTSSDYSFAGTSTVSSMIELVEYSMSAMGVSGGERVTFSQVEKYKQELESEFSKELSARIEATGVDPDAFFTVSLNSEGVISVDTAHADESKIQNYFNSNPSIGTDLLKSLEDQGYIVSESMQFNVSSSGSISMISSAQKDLQSAFAGNAVLGAGFVEGLELEEILFENEIELNFSEGALIVNGDDEEAQKIQSYINANPELADEVKAILEAEGIETTENIKITVDSEGNIAVDAPLIETDEEVQGFLNQNLVGHDFKTGLTSVGIDPNVDFRLSIVDGKVTVNSSHPDAAMVQALIDSDEELAKVYQQIDALAGIDSARQSMQIDPSALRTQIEMQSMAVWWANTGTSSFSSYADSSMSSMTGISTTV